MSGIREDIHEVRSDNYQLQNRVSAIEGWIHQDKTYYNTTGSNKQVE